MSLLDCGGCWEIHCTCHDGRGWLGLPVSRLQEIHAAIETAIATKATWQYDAPIGPEPAFSVADFTGAVSIPWSAIEDRRS